MDHIRSIKPEFFQDEALAKLVPLARILFVALWCQADRSGRLEDRPARIKVKALPYDECDVDAMLTELQLAGFIQRYGHEQARFIQVLKFEKHQRPNSREPKSEIPAPRVFTTGARARTRTHAHAHREGKGTEGNGKGREEESSASADVQAVFEHWKQVHGHPDAKLTPKRLGAIKGRLRDGYSVEQLKGAVQGCKASAFHQGDNEQRKVYDELTLICRDGEHVEQFIGYTKPTTALVLAGPQPPARAQMRRESMVAAVAGGLKGDGTLGEKS